MGTIKKLPETVRNTVRSGVVLFDLTRVVEELVFNSLDAGATKVSVFVGVGTCCVKVVDNGSGISRDGLMLLGERYATSKLQHLADMDTAIRTFGFRGEALASISEVSLLEIITKAYGRPNGYRKVMKGSKCLYLGIDDERKEVGTTVIARDLFYSQPVRRKYMQSSPKKVLHAVKKCLFRIALVHPKVSFKVVDIESEDELLSTHFSSSPLSLLMSGFGIEDSSLFHELSANDGVLRISGYISSPCDSFSMKVNDGPVKRKKIRSQACPSYIVNLSCPQSLYDLTFEPSKTYVVFKDWEPVLAFVEDAIHTVWMKILACGESFSHTADTVWKGEMWKKNDNIVSAEGEFFDADLAEDAEFALESIGFRNHRASLQLPSSPLEKLTKEDNHLFHGDCETIAFQEFQMDTTELKEKNTKMEFVCQTDSSFQSLDGSFAECLTTVPWKIDQHPQEADNSSSLREGYLLDNSLLASGISSTRVEGEFLSSQLGKQYLKTEPHVSNGLSGNALCFDRDECSNKSEMIMNIRKPFLLSCSSLGSLPSGEAKLGGEEEFESQIDSFKNKRKRICSDERDDILEVDASTHCFDLYSETLWQDEASYAQDLTKLMRKKDMLTGFDLQSRGFVKPFPYYGESFTEGTNFLSNSTTLVGNSGSGYGSLNSEWCSIISNPSHQAAVWDFGHFSNENAIVGMSRLGDGANYGQLENTEENCKFGYNVRLKSSNQESCTSICTSSALDFEDNDHSSEYLCQFPRERNLPNKFSLEHSDMLVDETDWFHSISSGKDFFKYENQRDWFSYQNCEPYSISKERSRRSHSAPPFPRQKKRFISLNHCSKMQVRESNINSFHHAQTFSEAVLKHLQQSSVLCHPNLRSSIVEDSQFGIRPDVVKKSDTMMDLKKTQKHENFKQPLFPQSHHVAHVEEFISKEILDSTDSGTKWQNSCPQTTIENNKNSCDIHNQDDILNISYGLLHLAGASLVPESISKNCLDDAKVLQQVDKKFIPVVAGGTLAVIDQHAADERIRLEELRQKVLSGEAKTVSYLDAEQELVLPEIGYQLLHNYAEQMKDWGWICNIHTPGSRSFKKNLSLLHRQPTVVTLLAVPCILGVNLSDVDLIEFLQQLADTDGSSTTPPAVLRVLNSKACRGAIMFGDSLLPSECSLIVEELKQTSLCFQCAHGRPTMVPLVNLEALHKQIAQLGVLNDNSSDSWHGLHRHETSLERASQRLRVARG